MLVSEERLQKALSYLATTDEPVSKAKARMKGLETQKDTIKAVAFLEAEGKGSQGEREHIAKASEAYRQWVSDYEEAVLDFELLNNKRNTEAMIVEVWRSLNASRRMGNV